MSQVRRLIWSPTAKGDLLAIARFIHEESPDRSVEFLERLQQRVTSLLDTPDHGRIVPEMLYHGVADIREVIVRPWRILYRAEDAEVRILAVLDSRRNVETLLLERYIR